MAIVCEIPTTLPQWPWLADWRGQPETRALADRLPGSRLARLLVDHPAETTLSLPEACAYIEDACRSYEAFLARRCRAHRKRHGMFYTPQALADAITRDALQLPAPSADNLRLADPACGTGNFLVAALERTAAGEGRACRVIAGYDIDPVALLLAEARCRLHAERLKLSGLQLAFSTDSVLETETPGWDILLGNPPYVSEVRATRHSGGSAFERLSESRSPYYKAKMDLCDAFLAWALEHLTPDGVLGYVLPVYWSHRSATAGLRGRLWEEGRIRTILDYGTETIFADAPGHHSSVLIWQKGEAVAQDTCEIQTRQGVQILMRSGSRFVWERPERLRLLQKLSERPPLFRPSEIQQGVILPQGRLRKTNRFPAGTGIFLLSDDEQDRLSLVPEERAWLKPFYMTGTFKAWRGWPSPDAPDEWLIYADAGFRERIDAFPNLKRHLLRFEAEITSDFAPFGLHRPRQPEWFEGGVRIYGLRQTARPAFACVAHPAYVREGFLILRPEPPEGIDPCLHGRAVTALLNSDWTWFWLYHQKRKGERLQIDKDVLAAFPMPLRWTEADMRQLAAAGEAIASGMERSDAVNKMVLSLYGLDTDAMAILTAWRSERATSIS